MFSGSVSVYRHTIRDKISTVWNMSQDTSYYSNVDKATLKGLDIQLQFRFSSQWRLRGGYSYVCDRQMVDGYNTSSTRPHSGNMLFEYAFKLGNTRYTASLNGRYLGRVKVYGQDEATKRFLCCHLSRLYVMAAFHLGRI
jgi:TonB dependent receptor.